MKAETSGGTEVRQTMLERFASLRPALLTFQEWLQAWMGQTISICDLQMGRPRRHSRCSMGSSACLPYCQHPGGGGEELSMVGK